MVPRHVATEIEEGLDRQAAAALIGARNVGKTTLALEEIGLRGLAAERAGEGR